MKENDLIQELIKVFKKKKYKEALKIINEKFEHLFDSSNLLLLEPYLEKIPEKLKNKNPLSTLLLALIYSRKNEEKKLSKILKDFGPENLEVPYKDIYFYIIALHYVRKKKFNLALKLIESGYEFSSSDKKKEMNKFVKSRLKNLEGLSFAMKDMYESAINSFKEAIEISKELQGSENFTQGVMLNLGTVYFLKADFRKTIEIFKELMNKVDDLSIKSRILRKLSLCYLYLNKIDYAKKLLEDAKKIINTGLEEFYKVYIYMTLTEIFIYEKKLEDVRKYISLMKKLSERYSFFDLSFHIKTLEIKYYLMKKEPKKALELIENSGEIMRDSLLAEFLLYKAISCFALSDIGRADVFFERALKTATQESYIRLKILIIYLIFKYKVNKKIDMFLLNEIRSFKNNEKGIIFYILKTESECYPFNIPADKVMDFIF